MVTMRSDGFTSATRMEHERCTSSLMCTEQAPHCAMPQPYLVPVRPTCSRMTHRRGVSASTSTSRTLPLILSFAIDVLTSRDCVSQPEPPEAREKARQEIADTLAIKIPDHRMAHHALGQVAAAGYAKIICGLAPEGTSPRPYHGHSTGSGRAPSGPKSNQSVLTPAFFRRSAILLRA